MVKSSKIKWSVDKMDFPPDWKSPFPLTHTHGVSQFINAISFSFFLFSVIFIFRSDLLYCMGLGAGPIGSLSNRVRSYRERRKKETWQFLPFSILRLGGRRRRRQPSRCTVWKLNLPGATINTLEEVLQHLAGALRAVSGGLSLPPFNSLYCS